MQYYLVCICFIIYVVCMILMCQKIRYHWEVYENNELKSQWYFKEYAQDIYDMHKQFHPENNYELREIKYKFGFLWRTN